MHNTRLLPLLLIILLSALHLISAANPTSFCKCTCGSESEIIALDAPASPPRPLRLLVRRAEGAEPGSAAGDQAAGEEKAGAGPADGPGGEDGGGGGKKEFKARTCGDCNRQFCLDYNLPQCKKVAEKEVFTQCFQRDSAKDQAVVFLFIFATVSLLGWALLKPWIGGLMQRATERNSYMPVDNDGGI